MIAAGFGKDAEVVQAIKWDAVRQKAHKMKEYRTPELYLPHMRLVREPKYPVLILDDVVTTGSQMIAATRLLRTNKFEVRRGLAIAKAVHDQREGAYLGGNMRTSWKLILPILVRKTFDITPANYKRQRVDRSKLISISVASWVIAFLILLAVGIRSSACAVDRSSRWRRRCLVYIFFGKGRCAGR